MTIVKTGKNMNMAQAGSAKFLRQREVKCLMCLDRLRRPRMLPCAHSFCQYCLEAFVQEQTVQCVVCRKSTNLGPGGVRELPQNPALISMMDSLCEQCLFEDRERRCGHCNKWLCENCFALCEKKLALATTCDELLEEVATQEKQTSEKRTDLIEAAQLVVSKIEAHGTDMVRTVQLNTQSLQDEVQQELNKQLDVLDEGADKFDDLKTDISHYREDRLNSDYINEKDFETLSSQWRDTLMQCSVDMSQDVFSWIEFVPDKMANGVGKLSRNKQTRQPATDYAQASTSATTATITRMALRCDYEHVRFEHFTFGSYGSACGQFKNPTRVGISPISKNIIVLDNCNNRIQVFNQRYEFVLTFGSTGHEIGQFDFGWGGLSVTDDGLIVVSDTKNDRLQVFTERGLHVRSIGSRGSGPEQFLGPEGLVIHEGLIYVCDSFNCRIQVLDFVGKFIRQFSVDAFPFDITMHQTGDIYVTAQIFERLEENEPGGGLFVFSMEEEFDDDVFNTDSDAYGVTTDNSGNIIVSDYSDHNVRILSVSRGLLRTLGSKGNGPGQLCGPVGLVCGQDGQIVVADSGNHRVQVFSIKHSAC